jgi:hypothetical protein
MERNATGRQKTVGAQTLGRPKTLEWKSRRSAKGVGCETVRARNGLEREVGRTAEAVAQSARPSQTPRRRSGQEMMVSHVVLMKPHPDLEPSARAALLDAFEHAPREIPTVRHVRLGRRIRHAAGYEGSAPDVSDYFALIDFDDLAGLQTYLQHPAHAQLGARFGESLRVAWVYDFEVGGVDALRAGGFA